MTWAISRVVSFKLFGVEISKVPPWTGFHSFLTAKVSFPTAIGNCRPVPAPPTDYDVIYTVLVNVKKMLGELNQTPAIITCDEAVYALSKVKFNGCVQMWKIFC